MNKDLVLKVSMTVAGAMGLVVLLAGNAFATDPTIPPVADITSGVGGAIGSAQVTGASSTLQSATVIALVGACMAMGVLAVLVGKFSRKPKAIAANAGK